MSRTTNYKRCLNYSCDLFFLFSATTDAEGRITNGKEISMGKEDFPLNTTLADTILSDPVISLRNYVHASLNYGLKRFVVFR